MKLRKLTHAVSLESFGGAKSAEAEHLHSSRVLTHGMFCGGG